MKKIKNETGAPRLKDVARQAGVSPTTASMVFTGTGRISEDTKQRVVQAADTMGYRHHHRERKTVKNTHHVALLILIDPEWTFIWHFIAEMISQIQQDLTKLGLKTVMIPISHHDDDDMIYQKITKLGCRAVFSIHIGKDTLFQRLESEGIPVVLIMNNKYQDKYFSICVDDFQGAYEGARFLLSLGHRRIDFVDAQREDLPILSTDRYYGYRKALEEEGIDFQDDHRISCEIGCSEEEIEERFRRSLDGPNAPSALFCLDDEIAFRAWNALSRLGYSIPRDISILAPGDVLDYTKPYIPQITTMHIDMTYVGRLAVNMLENRLSNRIETVHVLKVKQQLVDRGSCRSFS